MLPVEQKMKDKGVTLLQIRQGSDFNRSVERVFRSEDAAHRFLETGNWDVKRVKGKWKKGDRIPSPGPRMESMDAYYTTGYNGLLAEQS